eukprot:622707-Pyramimonas_sp.AAC.1
MAPSRGVESGDPEALEAGSFFIGFVQNALLGGLESFVVTEAGADILGRCLAGLGRVAMSGTA